MTLSAVQHRATKKTRWFKRAESAISGGFLFKGSQMLAALSGTCIVMLAAISLVTVAGRRSPWAGTWLTGGNELTELLMAMVTVLGAAYTWYAGGHVRVTALRDRWRPKTQAAADAASALIFVIWAAGVAYSVWGVGVRNLSFGEKTWGLGIPVGPFQLVFSLVMLHFVLVLLRSFFRLVAEASGPRVEP